MTQRPSDRPFGATPGWQLVFVASVELLAMALWFCVTAVVPQLSAAWSLAPGEQSWLTISVQLGFAVGAFTSAAFNLPDRVYAPWLLAGSALAAAVGNLLIAWLLPENNGQLADFCILLALRFWTGLMLAGVYPVGMKLMVSWFVARRGIAIGIMVGALAVGSALPQLFLMAAAWREGASMPRWPVVLYIASGAAVLAAGVAALFVRPGPHLPKASRFHWKFAAAIFKERPLALTNAGYLGHMWELYAMWTWVPLLLLESFNAAKLDPGWARLAAFAAIASGGLGSLIAGWWADRVGRTTITILSLIGSGCCAVACGLFFDQPMALAALCVLWGLFVVADSAQFSAAASELCEPSHVGTILAIQTSSGFLLTPITIFVTRTVQQQFGWWPAMALLAIGPAFGVMSMFRLRQRPESLKMARGAK